LPVIWANFIPVQGKELIRFMLDFQVAVARNSFTKWSATKNFKKFIKKACNRESLKVQFKKIKRQAKNRYLYLSVPSYFIRLFHTGTAFNKLEVFLLQQH
jgi:hypothetical protein